MITPPENPSLANTDIQAIIVKHFGQDTAGALRANVVVQEVLSNLTRAEILVIDAPAISERPALGTNVHGPGALSPKNRQYAPQGDMDPITEAIDILFGEAESIRESHTPANDRENWEGEEDARRAYDRLQRVIASLSRVIAPGGTEIAPSSPADGHAMTDAARDVLAERQRQMNAEGISLGQDDCYTRGELAQAAACYAASSASRDISYIWHLWPWSNNWWKPGTSRRDLVKAGALILAEIERQDRARATFEARRKRDA